MSGHYIPYAKGFGIILGVLILWAAWLPITWVLVALCQAIFVGDAGE